VATRRIVPRAPDATDLVWTFFGYGDDDEAMLARRLDQLRFRVKRCIYDTTLIPNTLVYPI
jgi:hypothetical protein